MAAQSFGPFYPFPFQFSYYQHSSSSDWLPLRVPVQLRFMEPTSDDEVELMAEMEFLQ